MRIDADEVRRLIAGGEGTRLELKAGLPRRWKVARTLAAFANTRGGHLLVGVDDDGRAVGLPDPKAAIDAVRAIAADDVEPPVRLQARAVELDGRPVAVAFVGLSDARPHAVRREDGAREVPVRLGSSTRSARGPALEALRRGAGAKAGLAGLDALERRVLAWVAGQGDAGTDAQGAATPQAFAKAANVGVARARRAFVKLERAGRLVGHGKGARRSYARP